MDRDPENHTRWKHEGRWHNRWDVWDKIVTDWAGEEEWMREGKVKSTLADLYKFVTFALDRVKLSTAQKKKSNGIGKKEKEKIPRDLGLADTTIHTRADGPTVQLCGDSNVACTWINGQYSLEQTEAEFGRVQKTLHPWWKEKIANPISKIDDFVKHVFREHTQEGRPLGQHWCKRGRGK